MLKHDNERLGAYKSEFAQPRAIGADTPRMIECMTFELGYGGWAFTLVSEYEAVWYFGPLPIFIRELPSC